MSAPRCQTVFIARHGNREDFVDRTWRDRAARPHDPALSPDGREQARRLGRRLKGEGIRHIFASPFLRTVETAFYVAEELELEVKVEHGAAEWLKPEWFPIRPEYLSLEELRRLFPRVDTAYVTRVTPEYPEHSMELHTWTRNARAVRLLAEEFPGPLLFIGHGASVHGLANGLVGGCPPINCGLCALLQIEREADGWRLVLNGDQSHLEDAEREKRFH